MKSYTDLEQSKKLAEILPVESADMGWNVFVDNSARCLPINDWDLYKDGSNGVKFIPAWSLAALIDVLPDTMLGKDKDGYVVMVETMGSGLTTFASNSIDVCVEMIVKLNEKDLS